MSKSSRYEMMVIIRPDLNQKETEQELKIVRDHIKGQKGAIFHEDIWGVRKLAYKIGKHYTAYYAIFYFDMDPKGIKELNHETQLEANIMRHLISSIPANYDVKSGEMFELADEVQIVFKPETSSKPSHFKKKEGAEEEKEAPKKAAKKTAAKSEDKPKEAEKEEIAEVAETKETPKKTTKAPKKKDDDDKAKLEEIDDKLQSIINDPDIMNI